MFSVNISTRLKRCLLKYTIRVGVIILTSHPEFLYLLAQSAYARVVTVVIFFLRTEILMATFASLVSFYYILAVILTHIT